MDEVTKTPRPEAPPEPTLATKLPVKITVTARVFRAATGTWEEPFTIAEEVKKP